MQEITRTNLKLIASMVCRELGQHNHKLLVEGVPTKEDLPCCHGTRKRFWMLWRECVCPACKPERFTSETAIASNWPICDGTGYVLIEHGKLKGLIQAAEQEGISLAQTVNTLIFRRKDRTFLYEQQGRWSLYEGLVSALVEMLSD